MLGTFLDKLNTLFDRRFVLAYWTPIFVLFGLAGICIAVIVGPVLAFNWWAKIGASQQLVAGIGLLVSITVLAYVLEGLTTPVVRFFEGYWPAGALTRWARDRERVRREKSPDSARYNTFPIDSGLLKPTRLGNVLAAAEEYPHQLYRLDAVLWWPRIAAVLPAAVRTQVDGALTPMLAMLNLSITLALVAAASGVAMIAMHGLRWQFGAFLLAEVVLARVCYLAACTQAVDYGATVRVAFDLYRFDLLKQMHVPLPDNLFSERLLWELLNQWVYSYAPPWEIGAISDAALPADPFFNDTHSPEKPARPQEINLRIKNKGGS